MQIVLKNCFQKILNAHGIKKKLNDAQYLLNSRNLAKNSNRSNSPFDSKIFFLSHLYAIFARKVRCACHEYRFRSASIKLHYVIEERKPDYSLVEVVTASDANYAR